MNTGYILTELKNRFELDDLQITLNGAGFEDSKFYSSYSSGGLFGSNTQTFEGQTYLPRAGVTWVKNGKKYGCVIKADKFFDEQDRQDSGSLFTIWWNNFHRSSSFNQGRLVAEIIDTLSTRNQ